jgi:hypothetical protein
MEGLLVAGVIFVVVIFFTDSFWIALIAGSVALSYLEVDVEVALKEIESAMKDETHITEPLINMTPEPRTEFVTREQTNSEKIYNGIEGVEKEPFSVVKKVTSEEEYVFVLDTTSLIDEYISDQMIDYSIATVIDDNEACLDTDDCFDYRLRKQSGIVYVCEMSGSMCYGLSNE